MAMSNGRDQLDFKRCLNKLLLIIPNFKFSLNIFGNSFNQIKPFFKWIRSLMQFLMKILQNLNHFI